MGTHKCSATCTAGWTGTRKAHCSGCGHSFSAPGPFDKHRRDGACLNPADVGLVKTAQGLWAGESDPDFAARFAKK